MTHDELILLIDTNSGGYLSKGNFVPLDEEVLGFVYALRAVVKLHKPTSDGLGCEHEYIDCHSQSGLRCDDDCNTYVPYPCKTIQAIEGQLK